MTEKGQDWQQRIAHSDGNDKIDPVDRIVIQDIKQYIDHLPPDRAERLIQEMEKILSQKEKSKHEITVECRAAIDRLRQEVWEDIKVAQKKAEQEAMERQKEREEANSKRTIFQAWAEAGREVWIQVDIIDKTKNIATWITAEAEARISRITEENWWEQKIVMFSGKERNETITISDFERKLGREPIEKISSRWFANYLIFLHEQNGWYFFNSDYLREILGTEKLLRLGILWNITPLEEASSTTEAQTHAQKFLESEGNGSVKLAFSEILKSEMKLRNRTNELEKLKQLDSFPQTEQFLKEKGLTLEKEDLNRIMKSGDIVQIITELRDKKLVLKTEQEAKVLFEAISADARQNIKQAEARKKETNINGADSVAKIGEEFGLEKEKFHAFANKKLDDLDKGKLVLLLGAASVSKAEQRDRLIFWIQNRIKELDNEKLAQKADDAGGSKAVLRKTVAHTQGKTSKEQYGETMQIIEDLSEKRRAINILLWGKETMELVESMGFTIDELKNNEWTRRRCLKQLKKIKDPSDAQKQLISTLEQFEHNEKRRHAFESGWVKRLKEYDRTEKELKKKMDSPTKEETNPKVTKSSGVPFERINAGEPHTAPLFRNSPQALLYTVESAGHYTYDVTIHGNSIQIVWEENVRPYLNSLRLFEKCWLGCLMRQMTQRSLSDLLSSLTEPWEVMQIDNTTGLENDEKLRILEKFSRLVGIENIPRSIDEGRKRLNTHFFIHGSFEDILAQKRIIHNGRLDENRLREALKSSPPTKKEI